MGWPGPRRRTVPLKLSDEEERPVRAVADAEHEGNLSAAIRALLAEALTGRTNADELNQLRLLVGVLINDDSRAHTRLFALEAVAEAVRGAIVDPPGTDWWYRTRAALNALDALPAPRPDIEPSKPISGGTTASPSRPDTI